MPEDQIQGSCLLLRILAPDPSWSFCRCVFSTPPRCPKPNSFAQLKVSEGPTKSKACARLLAIKNSKLRKSGSRGEFVRRLGRYDHVRPKLTIPARFSVDDDDFTTTTSEQLIREPSRLHRICTDTRAGTPEKHGVTQIRPHRNLNLSIYLDWLFYSIQVDRNDHYSIEIREFFIRSRPTEQDRQASARRFIRFSLAESERRKQNFWKRKPCQSSGPAPS